MQRASVVQGVGSYHDFDQLHAVSHHTLQAALRTHTAAHNSGAGPCTPL